MWFCPLIGAIFGLLMAVIVYQVDPQVTLPAGWQYALQTALILIAVVTAFLAMEGVKYLLATGKQARSRGEANNLAGRAQRRTMTYHIERM